jgi:hypothetical protein
MDRMRTSAPSPAVSAIVYLVICAGSALIIQSGKELMDGDVWTVLPRFLLAVLAGATAVTAAAFALRKQFSGTSRIEAKLRVRDAVASLPFTARPAGFMGGTFALTLFWMFATHVAEDSSTFQHSDIVSCILVSLLMALLSALLSYAVNQLVAEVASFLADTLAYPPDNVGGVVTAYCDAGVAHPYSIWPPPLFSRPPPLQL